jgi:hypothetical protein
LRLASPGRKLWPILVYCIFKSNKLLLINFLKTIKIFLNLIKYNPFIISDTVQLICVNPDVDPVVDSSTFSDLLSVVDLNVGISTSFFVTSTSCQLRINVDVVADRSRCHHRNKWDITLIILTKPN